MSILRIVLRDSRAVKIPSRRLYLGFGCQRCVIWGPKRCLNPLLLFLVSLVLQGACLDFVILQLLNVLKLFPLLGIDYLVEFGFLLGQLGMWEIHLDFFEILDLSQCLLILSFLIVPLLLLDLSVVLLALRLSLLLLLHQVFNDAELAEDVPAQWTGHRVHKTGEAQLTLVESLLRIL